jgi:hypothetical protein
VDTEAAVAGEVALAVAAVMGIILKELSVDQ